VTPGPGNERNTIMSAASLRHRSALAGFVAVALMATACAGSSSSAGAAASDTTGAATTSAAGTSAAASTSTGNAAPAATRAPTSAAARTSSSAPTAVTTTKVKATGGGDFCKNIAKAVNNPISPTGGTSLEDEKALIQKSLAQGVAALGKAPSAIKPDALIVLTAVANLFKALEAANYDYTKIDPSALAAVSSPAVTTAEAHLEAYVKTNCGFSVTSG
jgi:hypothetical protein